MFFRKVLVGLLIVILASPAWGGAEALGNITSSNAATVRGTKLTPGSTVFNGDAISVGEHGVMRIALASGAQAEVLGNSLVRLTKTGETIQMVVDRGQASFHTSGSNGVEALVADASIRAANGKETSALIQALSATHAVVAAEKGTLLLTTARDGKTYTVHEGDAADLSLASAGQQDGEPSHAGNLPPSITIPRKTVILVVIVIAGASAITAYLLLRRGPTPSPPPPVSTK